MWWHGTRHLDFMTPPADSEIEQVRARTRESVPGRARLFSTSRNKEEVREPVVPEPIRKPPAIDPGDPTMPAPLTAYSEHAGKDAADFIELAIWLEDQGYGSRALLAWERVIDLCQPEEEQLATALAGVARLRPESPLWNIDPLAATPLVLQVVVPADATTDEFRATVASVAEELEDISAGQLSFEPKIEAPPKGDRTRGLSIRITGSSDRQLSTGTFQLEAIPETPEGLAYHLFSGVFKLVAAQVAATSDFTPPPPPSERADPREALLQRITRRIWSEFGASLVPPAKGAE